MANQYINNMTALWNSAGTTYAAIKMNVTNAASSATSKLIQMQVGAVDKFTVDKLGSVTAAGIITATGGLVTAGTMLPAANDTAALGTSGTAWSDLFLASGGVINWAAGDITITHGTNQMFFGGASAGYLFDAPIKPQTNDSTSIGQIGTAWSDIFLAVGAVIDFASTDVTITHTTDTLTVGGGDFRVPLAGADPASVVTLGAAQTLTSKTLTNPVLNSPTINTPSIANPTITGTITAATMTTSGNITAAGNISGATITASSSVIASQNFVSSTTTVVLAPSAAGSILLRPNGAASATGQITVSSAGAITTAGDINCNDLHSSRVATPATGVVYLGNTGHYLFFDGTSYSMPGGALTVGGAITCTGTLAIGGAAANYISLTDIDNATRHIHHNGGLIGFLNSGGGWVWRVDDSGATWSAQFGDFNTYWEGRCGAHQDAAVNRVPGTVGNINAGAVGAHGYLCRDGGGGAMGVEAVIAGGSLAWSNSAGNINGRPGGSWKCLGYVQSGSTTTGAATLWTRYA